MRNKRYIADDALDSRGLTLNLKKWAKQVTHYLGYELGNGEIQLQVHLNAYLWSSQVLQSPDFTKHFLLQVNMSALDQCWHKESQERNSLCYTRFKLLPRKVHYSCIEKECLAINWDLDSRRYYLLEWEFDLDTDHQALTCIRYPGLQPFWFRFPHQAGH